MLAPSTVIDSEPDAARFLKALMLLTVFKATASTVQAWLRLLPCSPTVITTLFVPPEPWPRKQVTDVADIQCVASIAECASWSRDVCIFGCSPRLVPRIITLTELAPAVFAPVTALNRIQSNETTSVTQPACCPTDMTSRRVPRVPRATLHLRDESDFQSVTSHPVNASRIR